MAQSILDAKYEKTEISDVASKQTHLNSEQQKELYEVLTKHEKLFDGTLGVYPHKKVHLEVKTNAHPVHMRLYTVTRIHLDTYKRELDHLVDIGVLSSQQTSKWASPNFIIPKKMVEYVG